MLPFREDGTGKATHGEGHEVGKASCMMQLAARKSDVPASGRADRSRLPGPTRDGLPLHARLGVSCSS